jgi:hypothetical protein
VRIINKHIVVCDDSSAVFNFFDESIINFAVLTVNGLWTAPDTYDATPSWFTAYNDGFGNYSSYLFVPSNVPTGTYPISFSGTDGNEYIIIIEKTATCEGNVFTNKCCPSINLVWVNQNGGFENYIFSGKRQVYEVTEGESETFKTYDMTIKNAEIAGIYTTVLVNTGVMPSSHLAKIESLKKSIQAWLYDETLPIYYEFDKRFTPIFLDREAIITADNREQVIERTIKFRVAKEANIQSQ